MNKPMVAELLNMPDSSVYKIKRMSGRTNAEVDGDRFYTEEVEGKQRPFQITVQVTDPAVLPELEAGLAHYFQSNEYVQFQLSMEEASFQENVASLEDQLAYLDSTKALVIKLMERGENNTRLPNLADLARQAWELNVSLQFQYNDHDLNLNDLQVIKPFMASKRKDGPKLTMHLLFGALAGLAVGLLVFAVVDVRRKV